MATPDPKLSDPKIDPPIGSILADRPLTCPHESRLRTDDPLYQEILEAHAAALEEGQIYYCDPKTGYNVLTARYHGSRELLRHRLPPLSVRPVSPTARRKAWMSWSSGKDSALALATARLDDEIEVTELLCTVNAEADRIAMHAVRRTLLEAQADRLGLPLRIVEIPSPCPNEVYEERIGAAIAAAQTIGIEHMVFGDLFLRDIRAYRESNLAGTGISPLFPLWLRPTAELAIEMIDSGIRAHLTCVDPAKLPAAFAGRSFDRELLADLPPCVDPCGENGEFHTFVSDGPGFRSAISVEVGEVVERDGFVFCDLLG